MRTPWLPVTGVLAVLLMTPYASSAQAGGGVVRDAVEVRIWLERANDVPLRVGDRSRVYYRSAQDAYVAVFRIETGGRLQLLFPSRPGEEHRLRGGRDYRLLFQGEGDWTVEDESGVGYYFILASPTPFEWGRFAIASGSGEWELAQDGVEIRQDPHLAVNEVASLLLGGESGRGHGLDFTSYHVGQSYSYPRFLCYNCHEVEDLADWNPYRLACEDYRIVIYNDPYFYPTTRYQGTRVLHPAPAQPPVPQYAFASRTTGEPGTPLVLARNGPAGREVRLLAQSAGTTFLRDLEEEGTILTAAAARQTAPSNVDATERASAPAGQVIPAATVNPTLPAERPTLQRRTSQPSGR